MKIIATIVGPIKRFVDMEVLVTEMDPVGCPIDPQVVHTKKVERILAEISFQIVRIVENDCIGFFVTNRRPETLVVEKRSQEICCISVWCKKNGGY